jgi:sugar phosphate isomerase/epimerase
VNRVGATTLGFGSRTIDEVFAGLAAVGAECCELNGRPGQHGGETLSAHRVLPLAKAHGIAVTSVGGYNDFTLPGETDEQVERLMVAVRLAGEIGAPLVRAMVGDLRHDVTLDSCFDTVVTGFRRAAASAAKFGVTLGIENHGRLANDGAWLVAVVDAVGAENIGFTLDTGNFAWSGRSPEVVAADIAAVLPRTVNVHVKDVQWSPEGRYEHFVTAGEGGIDLPGIVATLRDHGYAGPIVSEYEGPGDHAVETARSIAHLKTLVR